MERKKNNLKKCFEEYCACTSIHGVQYIGKKDLPLKERICWIFLLISGALVSGYFISFELFKWKNAHVIITYNSTFSPVWEIPFPTVTICSENKYHSNLSDIFEKNESEINDDAEMLKIVEAAIITSQVWDTKAIFNAHTGDILDTIREVAPSLISVISDCAFVSYGITNCNADAFRPVYIDKGLCFSFNSLEPNKIYNLDLEEEESYVKNNKSNWSLEHGYTSLNFSSSYPYRGGGTLELYLTGNSYVIDNWTRNPYQGFKIYLSNPADVAQSEDNFISVPPNSNVIVSVKPEIIVASDYIRKKYSPEQRRCYYPSERPLAFFKTYVQNNCKLECRTNYTLEKCGCVCFYMPRKPTTNICGSASLGCVTRAEEELHIESIMYYNGDLCNCLPDCNYLQYSYDFDTISSDWPQLFKVVDKNLKMGRSFLSVVKIHFYDDVFISKYRKETYVFSDFLANCGGFLGLFSGFSILSLFELIYHIIIRCRNNRKQQIQNDVKIINLS